jgi:PAS domain S-box-containing protein
MTLQLALVTAAALATLTLGGLVLFKNPAGSIHRYFALFTLSVAVWTLSSTFVLGYYPSPLWGRLAFGAASAIPLAFLLFTSVFPTPFPTPPRQPFIILKAVGASTFVLSFTPLILRDTVFLDGTLHGIYGPLYVPFCIYFVSCLAFSFYLLTQKLVLLRGFQKLQVRYLFLGVLVGAIGATITNLIVPLLFGTSRLSRYGPLFGLPMSAMIAHSIIRYRMMNIKIVIRKGVVYACALIAATSILAFFFMLFTHLTGYPKDTIPVVQAMLLALGVAILFHPLKAFVESSFNRYLYREAYDFQRTIRDASRRLSTMLDLDPLLDHLISVIEATFKAEWVTVYLQDRSGNRFLPERSTPHERWNPVSPLPLSETSPIVAWLRHNQKTLVREEAIRASQEDGRVIPSAHQLDDLDADLALPLKDEQSVIGAIIVGRKRSGDPYFAEDIDLLETLVSQAGVAMKNAQLYRQVVLVGEYVDNILSTMDSGVIAVNPEGQISLFNRAAERLTTLRASDVHGEPYQTLPGTLAAPLREALEARIPRSQFELTIQDSQGSEVPLVCSTAILRHKGSPGYGALVVFSDLTHLKDLEREKTRAQRLASFGALASGVAHEIKNPLVAIRTFAELLPERFTDKDFREDFAKVVVREIARIDGLVARLRGIAATVPKHVGTVDLREPISATLLLLRAHTEQTRTAVHYESQDSAPFVGVEDAQLKQLVLNLCLNAIEAMGSEGELRITVSRRALRGAQWIVFEVADTGPGIPESIRANIFDPFFTTKPGGTGLGLAICRGITDAHRGTIRAENRTDRSGTIIVVEFPATVDAPLFVEENAVYT